MRHDAMKHNGALVVDHNGGQMGRPGVFLRIDNAGQHWTTLDYEQARKLAEDILNLCNNPEMGYPTRPTNNGTVPDGGTMWPR
jgi:hypothetical protein